MTAVRRTVPRVGVTAATVLRLRSDNQRSCDQRNGGGPVSSVGPRVRSRRRPRRPTVAVTGAASGLGAGAGAPAGGARPGGVEGHRASTTTAAPSRASPGGSLDVRDPALVDPAVPRRRPRAPRRRRRRWTDDPASRRERNVRGTQTVLTAAAAAGVRRVVLLHLRDGLRRAARQPGAAAPRTRRCGPCPTAALRRGPARDRAAGRARRRARHPGLQVTVVRPAALVGPGIDTLVTRHFEAPRLLVVRDTPPRWQFCHVDDLVAALELAALGQVTGAVTRRLRRLARPGRGRAHQRAAAHRAARRRSRSAPPSGCTGSASSRRRPATCSTSCIRGWCSCDPAARGRLAADVRQPDRARAAARARCAATTPWPVPAGRPPGRDHRRRRGRGRRGRHGRAGPRAPDGSVERSGS